MKTGQAALRAAEGKGIDVAGIPGEVKAAGFTPGEISVTATGKIVANDGALWLAMPGPVARLKLTGEKSAELSGQKGNRLTVKGVLQLGKKGQPPELSVTSWSRD